MKFNALILAAAFAAGSSVGSAADAATLLFDYTGVEGTFEFASSDTPTPYGFQSNGNTSIAVTGTRNGAPSTLGGGITFYSGGYGGGFVTYDGISNYGPQIYSGSESAPTFTTGIYTVYANSAHTVTTGVLTISAAASPTPEPAAWVLMITGFGGIGCSLRLAKRKPSGPVRTA